jgi:hypothetical protein
MKKINLKKIIILMKKIIGLNKIYLYFKKVFFKKRIILKYFCKNKNKVNLFGTGTRW